MVKPYYSDKWTQIYCGNYRDILPQLDVNADLILTDPPYGLGHKYGGSFKDDLNTFVNSIIYLVSLNIRSVIFCPVCRLFDVPVRPQWVGVWRKSYGALALHAYPFYPHWEALLFYNLKGDYWGNKGHRSDVFDCLPAKPEEKGHPSPKPELLISELITFLHPSLILDPFLGSGTTSVCAKKLGISSIGIELDENYCEIAAKRCSQQVMELG